jgi:anti-sigma factor RsiW
MLVLLLLPHPDATRDLMSVRDAALRGGIAQGVATNIGAPAAVGFTLASARADIVAGHPARVFGYARADQTVTLCIWPAGGEPAHGVRDARYRGMTIRYWNDGKQEYWAASSGQAAVLDDFVAALRGA